VSGDWDDEPNKPRKRMKPWQLAVTIIAVLLVFVVAGLLD